jgi:phage baseplate assembly protein W
MRRYTEIDPKRAFYREDIRFPFVLTSRGDLETVTGEENLEQAIVERASTVRGELEHRRLYGLSNLDESENGPNIATAHAALQGELLEQYKRDSRIEDVSVTVEESDDDVTFFIEAKSKKGDSVSSAISLSPQ